MSNRITKYTAEKAANKLRDFYFNEKIDNANKSLNDFINALVDKYVAKPVLDMFDENKDLFKKECIASFYNNNEPSYWYNTKHLNIKPSRALPNKPLTIDDEDWKYLNIKIKELDELNTKAYNYVKEVASALTTLGTYSKISENFPEALPYINVDSVYDLNKLRNPEI